MYEASTCLVVHKAKPSAADHTENYGGSLDSPDFFFFFYLKKKLNQFLQHIMLVMIKGIITHVLLCTTREETTKCLMCNLAKLSVALVRAVETGGAPDYIKTLIDIHSWCQPDIFI